MTETDVPAVCCLLNLDPTIQNYRWVLLKKQKLCFCFIGLPDDKAGRDSREVWFIEKFPWSGLLTKVNFCSASCSVLPEVV